MMKSVGEMTVWEVVAMRVVWCGVNIGKEEVKVSPKG